MRTEAFERAMAELTEKEVLLRRIVKRKTEGGIAVPTAPASDSTTTPSTPSTPNGTCETQPALQTARLIAGCVVVYSRGRRLFVADARPLRPGVHRHHQERR